MNIGDRIMIQPDTFGPELKVEKDKGFCRARPAYPGEEYIVLTDAVEKKKISRAARNKNRAGKGPIRFPSDYKTKKERDAMNGEVATYNLIPSGLTLNWKKIWDNQALSPAFMREIEKVTRITNDYICDSKGVIVTEYCKRESTWVAYRDTIRYELSDDFVEELLPVSLVQEEAKAAKSEQKQTNDLQLIMDMVAKGVDYWTSLLQEGAKRSMLSYQEQTALRHIISIASTGSIPASRTGKLSSKTLTTVKIVQAARDKLEAEGIVG